MMNPILPMMPSLMSVMGFVLAFAPVVFAGFDPSSSSNIAVYWGTMSFPYEPMGKM